MKNRKISASLAELIDKAENSQRDIKTYVDKLDEYKSEFNFVLLSKAFSKLLQTKQEEYRKITIPSLSFQHYWLLSL